jgi:hypothetical protein
MCLKPLRLGTSRGGTFYVLLLCRADSWKPGVGGIGATSSRGSTPKASASLRTVRGCAVRLPSSKPEIVACVVPANFASSDCESISPRLSSRSLWPSTFCQPLMPLFYAGFVYIQCGFDIT